MKKKKIEVDDSDTEYESDPEDDGAPVDIGGWSQRRSMCDDGGDADGGDEQHNDDGDDDDNDDKFLSSTLKEGRNTAATSTAEEDNCDNRKRKRPTVGKKGGQKATKRGKQGEGLLLE